MFQVLIICERRDNANRRMSATQSDGTFADYFDQQFSDDVSLSIS
jgi:hypothetical protein